MMVSEQNITDSSSTTNVHNTEEIKTKEALLSKFAV